MIHLLLTDVLIWLLVFAVLLFAWHSSRYPHLRAPWVQVFSNPMGAATGVILLAYAVIGLADSIHFYPKPNVVVNQGKAQTQTETKNQSTGNQALGLQSVLDVALRHMKSNVEETYSAPLATHSFAKKTRTNPDTGNPERVFPPLKYGGQHLQIGQSVMVDVLKQSAIAAAYALLLWLLLIVPCIAWVSIRNHSLGFKVRTKQALFSLCAWSAANYTLLLILMIGAILWQLSHYYHVFGTDKVGYDVLYITLKSVRTGLVIGTLTTLIMLPLALLLGLSAGYFGGWVDDAVQYIYTTISSVPSVLLIAAAVLMLDLYMHTNAEQFTSVVERADWRLFFICLIMGITSWTGLCRLLRAETIKLREMNYVESARAFAQSHAHILLKHILPNTMHIVLITIVLDFSGLVLAEAVLSYIGIGVDPSTHSWGNMINAARMEMAREPMVWWSLVASFVAMFVLVLSANLFTDVVRSAFDPRTRTRA